MRIATASTAEQKDSGNKFWYIINDKTSKIDVLRVEGPAANLTKEEQKELLVDDLFSISLNSLSKQELLTLLDEIINIEKETMESDKITELKSLREELLNMEDVPTNDTPVVKSKRKKDRN